MRLLLPALLVFASSTAISTTFAPREFPDAVKDAPIVVHGEVLSTRAKWGKGMDSGRRIYTYVELRNDEVLKGSVEGRTLLIRELGGQVEGLSLEIPGTAKFKVGEDVVVFLSPRNADGSYDVRGLMMGKYDVEKNPEGEEVLSGGELSLNRHHALTPDHDHHHGEEEGQSGPGVTVPSPRKWTINSLRELIRTQPQAEKSVDSPGLRPDPGSPTRVSAPGNSRPVDAAPTLPENEGAEIPREGGSGWITWGLVALGVLGLAALFFGVLRP